MDLTRAVWDLSHLRSGEKDLPAAKAARPIEREQKSHNGERNLSRIAGQMPARAGRAGASKSIPLGSADGSHAHAPCGNFSKANRGILVTTQSDLQR